MVAAAQRPVSVRVVAYAFVQQYYHILHHSPSIVHHFYKDISKIGRPKEDGSMTTTTTMQAINEKIVSLHYDNFAVEIKSVDAQESYGDGILILVIGCLKGKDNRARDFAQYFFLAPQNKGYFILNDIFRFFNITNSNCTSVNDDIVSPESQPVPPVAALPVMEDYINDALEFVECNSCEPVISALPVLNSNVSEENWEDVADEVYYYPPENIDVQTLEEKVRAPKTNCIVM